MITQIAPDPTAHDQGPEVFHWVCDCDDNTALCGRDVTNDPWSLAGRVPPCPLCVLVQYDPCPQCGALPDADRMED